jgi:hypothetical protein
VIVVLLALSLTGCSSRTHLTLHVRGPVSRAADGRCVFFLRAKVREGGTQRTCLTSIDGFPAPNVTMHSKGTMTLALPRGVVVLRIRVTQRFADDGAHARQTLDGVIVRGRRDFAGARGSMSGGGDVVDTHQAIRIGELVYRLAYTR